MSGEAERAAAIRAEWAAEQAGVCHDCGHPHGDAMCNETIPTMRGDVVDEYVCNCTGPHPYEPEPDPRPATFQLNPDPPF